MIGLKNYCSVSVITPLLTYFFLKKFSEICDRPGRGGGGIGACGCVVVVWRGLL